MREGATKMPAGRCNRLTVPMRAFERFTQRTVMTSCRRNDIPDINDSPEWLDDLRRHHGAAVWQYRFKRCVVVNSKFLR